MRELKSERGLGLLRPITERKRLDQGALHDPTHRASCSALISRSSLVEEIMLPRRRFVWITPACSSRRYARADGARVDTKAFRQVPHGLQPVAGPQAAGCHG